MPEDIAVICCRYRRRAGENVAKVRRAWRDDARSRRKPVPNVFACGTDRRTHRARWVCGYTKISNVVVGEENDVVGLKLSIEATWQHRDVLHAILHLRPFHPLPSTGHSSNIAALENSCRSILQGL
jgi:hypothetical protein